MHFKIFSIPYLSQILETTDIFINLLLEIKSFVRQKYTVSRVKRQMEKWRRGNTTHFTKS